MGNPIRIDENATQVLELDVRGATDGNLVVVPNDSDEWWLNFDVTTDHEQVLMESKVVIQELVNQSGHKAMRIVVQGPEWYHSVHPLRVLVTLRMPYNAKQQLKALLFNAPNSNVYIKSSASPDDLAIDS